MPLEQTTRAAGLILAAQPTPLLAPAPLTKAVMAAAALQQAPQAAAVPQQALPAAASLNQVVTQVAQWLANGVI